MALGPIGGPIGGRPQRAPDSNVEFAQISFTGSATMAADADLAAATSVDFDGVATMDVAATAAVTHEAAVNLTGVGTMLVEAFPTRGAEVAFTGSGVFVLEAFANVTVTVDYSGVATMLAHPAQLAPPTYFFNVTVEDIFENGEFFAFLLPESPALGGQTRGSIDQEPLPGATAVQVGFGIAGGQLYFLTDEDLWPLLEDYGLFIDGVQYLTGHFFVNADPSPNYNGITWLWDDPPPVLEERAYLFEWRPQAARYTGSADLSISVSVSVEFDGEATFNIGEVEHAVVEFFGEAEMSAFLITLHEVELTYIGEGTMLVAGGSAFMNLLEDPNARRIFTVELDPRLIVEDD